MIQRNPKGVVFLDRDDTIVKSYGNRPANSVDEIELLPGVPEGLRKLKEVGLRTVVATNQGGIGFGYMTVEVLKAMNERLNDLLILAGAPTIDAFYWCPHLPREGCECRKPRPGMFIKAKEDLGIDLGASYMIGDNVRDMEAAVCAGIRWPLVVVSDHYQDTPSARMIFPTFRDAATMVAMLESDRASIKGRHI